MKVKTGLLIILFLINVSCVENKHEEVISCLNSLGFDKLYDKVKVNNNSITEKKYEFYIFSEDEIRVNTKNELVGKVTREKGVFSIVMKNSKNIEIVNDIEIIICDLIR